MYDKLGADDRKYIISDDREVIVRLDWDGEQRNWLLTAYIKKSEAMPALRTLSGQTYLGEPITSPNPASDTDIFPTGGDVNTYTAEKIKINGKDKAVRNSAGQRIAKTEEGLRAFYEWFGDSKVVDENGRPLVVYHGTNTEFDTFDVRKANKTDWGFFGAGFYFAKSSKSGKAQAKNANIEMPVYLKMENPFYFNLGSPNLIIEKIKKEYKDYAENYNKNVEANERIDTDADIDESFFDRNGNINGSYNHAERFTSLLQDIGYDGVIVNNGEESVVFSPNQIKSVNNIGSFSRENDNIYYSESGTRDLFTPDKADERTYISDLRAAEKTESGKEVKIRLGNLPPVYKKIGITDGAVKTKKSIIIKDTISKHNVPLKIVENLPQLYSDPVIIFKALEKSTNKDSYVAVLDAVDKDGLQMIAALSPSKTGGYHLITSFYGRKNIDNMVRTAFEEGKVKYIDDIKIAC